MHACMGVLLEHLITDHRVCRPAIRLQDRRLTAHSFDVVLGVDAGVTVQVWLWSSTASSQEWERCPFGRLASLQQPARGQTMRRTRARPSPPSPSALPHVPPCGISSGMRIFGHVPLLSLAMVPALAQSASGASSRPESLASEVWLHQSSQ